jgi:ribosomal-protein-alanine N-acetyltransferase
LTAVDAPFVLALTNEPSFLAHIGDRGVRTIADAERYIASGPWTSDRALGYGLCLVELRDTRQPIGICGLLKRDALPAPDLGFAFRPAFWSRGYAFEAATRALAFAHGVLRVPEVLAIVGPSNVSSVRLLDKLGFRFDRLTRLSGEHDVALYRRPFDTIPTP